MLDDTGNHCLLHACRYAATIHANYPLLVAFNAAMGSGGGVAARASKDVAMAGVAINDNCAGATGGGSSVLQSVAGGAAGLRMTGSVVLRNCAVAGGGGVVADGSNFTLYGSVTYVGDNTAAHSCRTAIAQLFAMIRQGGNDEPAVPTGNDDTEASAPEVAASGGGILVRDSVARLDSSQVYRNTADSLGGGVAAMSASTLSVTYSAVWANTAREGGAGLAVVDSSGLVGSGSLVTQNVVPADPTAADVPSGGGALVSWTEAAAGTVAGLGGIKFEAFSTWTQNAAPRGGAVAVVSASDNATCAGNAAACASTAPPSDPLTVIDVPMTSVSGNSATALGNLLAAGTALYWENQVPGGSFASAATQASPDNVASQAVGLRVVKLGASGCSGGGCDAFTVPSGESWPVITVAAFDVYGHRAPLPAGTQAQIALASHSGSVTLTGATIASFSNDANGTAVLDGTLLLGRPLSLVDFVVEAVPALGLQPARLRVTVQACAAGSAPAPSGVGCTLCTPGWASHNGSSCAPCQPGFVQSQRGASGCLRCPAGRTSRLASTECGVCPPGFFAAPAADACIACPADGVTCTQGIASIQEGWWLPPAAGSEHGAGGPARLQAILTPRTKLYPCTPPDACEVTNGSHVECARGRQGPVCRICDDGLERSATSCVACPERWVSVSITAVGGVTVLLGCAVAVTRAVTMWKRVTTSGPGAGGGSEHPGTMAVLKVVLTHLQVSGWCGMHRKFTACVCKPLTVRVCCVWTRSLGCGRRWTCRGRQLCGRPLRHRGPPRPSPLGPSS